MVVMSMADCMNSTGFSRVGGGVFSFFFWVGGVYHKHERQYLTLSSLSSWITCNYLSLLRGLDCSRHIGLYFNRIFGLKSRNSTCI